MRALFAHLQKDKFDDEEEEDEKEGKAEAPPTFFLGKVAILESRAGKQIMGRNEMRGQGSGKEKKEEEGNTGDDAYQEETNWRRLLLSRR